MDDPTVYRSGSGRYYFQGLKVCGSVWSCPVCADRICRKRGHDLQELVRACEEQGGAVYLLTLTVRHHAGQSLEDVLTAIVESYRYLTGSGSWQDWRDEVGLLGVASALDATEGPNGWHPHRHVLLFTDAPIEADVRSELVTWLRDRWARVVYAWREGLGGGLARACRWRPDEDPPEHDDGEPLRASLRGQPDPPHDFPDGHRSAFGVPKREVGVQLDRKPPGDRPGEYVAKLGLGSEAVAMTVKQATGRHRTPLEILAAYARYRRPRDLARWKEWTRTMSGRQHLNTSPGLEDRLAAPQTELELTEQEAAEAHPEDGRELVAVVDRHLWRLTSAALDGGAQEFVRLMLQIHDGDLRRLGAALEQVVRDGPSPPGGGEVRTDERSRRVWWFGGADA